LQQPLPVGDSLVAAGEVLALPPVLADAWDGGALVHVVLAGDAGVALLAVAAVRAHARQRCAPPVVPTRTRRTVVHRLALLA
jgi:hypothetical protein